MDKLKAKIGDVFEIPTRKGKGYFQYVFENKSVGQLIRVLPGLYPERPEDINGIVVLPERYFIHFPLNGALNRKIIISLGNFPLPCDFKLPIKFRSKFIDKDRNLISWHIVDYKTWKREKVMVLTEEQKQLSEWGIWNDTLLIENLEHGWTLANWI
jgi:hypothetical protein